MCSNSIPFPHNPTFSAPKSITKHPISLLPIPPHLLHSNPSIFPPNTIVLHQHHHRFTPHPVKSSTSHSQPPYDPEETQQIEQEARDVVCEYLQELGVSGKESAEIALGCPKYLGNLIEGVRELDESSLWGSWNGNGGGSLPLLSFKWKVYQLAKQKGDNGIIPYLESLGLNLFSATHLARYLSSDRLANLISKVKFMKTTFFSDNDDDGAIGKNASRMMMHLSISTDDDIQQTLSFFEKIQARRGGLYLLGSRDVCFRHLVESFPRLLLLPLETRIKPMLRFLEDVGIPEQSKRNILMLFPPIIFYNIDKDIRSRLNAFKKIGVQDEDLGKMLLKYPWILSTSILDNYEKILHFFDHEKVPRVAVACAIRNWPLILGCSVNKLKLVVEQYGELGVKNQKLGRVIARSPQLLLQKPHEFLQVVSFLKDLGLDEETIGRILGRCPELFAASVEKTLKRKLDFLSRIGVYGDHLPRVIRKYPELFVCDADRALLPRMKYLTKAGLSERDVMIMVRRFSPLLGYSVDKVLRPKLDFLTNTMRKPLNEVVDYPRYFSYSLERKIKPRYFVLKSLNTECSLKDMLSKNDEEFSSEFMGIAGLLVPPP